jgi:peptidoglycan hydrolase CwlO-like protein
MQAADTPPPFDTQRSVENLQASGLSSVQAVAITRTLVDATANLVTKADLAALRSGLQTDLASVQSGLQTEIAGVQTEIDNLKQSVDENRKLIGQTRDSVVEVREEIGRIRVEFAQSHASTVRMMLFMSFGIIGAVVGLLRILPR